MQSLRALLCVGISDATRCNLCLAQLCRTEITKGDLPTDSTHCRPFGACFVSRSSTCTVTQLQSHKSLQMVPGELEAPMLLLTLKSQMCCMDSWFALHLSLQGAQ
jgi:hypothetical protein